MKRCLFVAIFAQFMLGCLSFHTWEGLKYSAIEVERIEPVNTNGVVTSIKFIGTKFIPIFPYCFLKLSNSVDTVNVSGNWQRMDINMSTERIENDEMQHVAMSDLQMASVEGGMPLSCHLTGPFWVQESTSLYQRNYIAIPMAKFNETNSSCSETIHIYKKPYFKYGSETYRICRMDEICFYGQMIFLLPPAIVADVLTSPLQVALTLFVHR